MAYKWFGDGYILIGFSSGYVVIISTHLKEIGQEVNSIRFHRDNLADVTFSPSLQKGASIGDNCIKARGSLRPGLPCRPLDANPGRVVQFMSAGMNSRTHCLQRGSTVGNGQGPPLPKSLRPPRPSNSSRPTQTFQPLSHGCVGRPGGSDHRAVNQWSTTRELTGWLVDPPPPPTTQKDAKGAKDANFFLI